MMGSISQQKEYKREHSRAASRRLPSCARWSRSLDRATEADLVAVGVAIDRFARLARIRHPFVGFDLAGLSRCDFERDVRARARRLARAVRYPLLTRESSYAISNTRR